MKKFWDNLAMETKKKEKVSKTYRIENQLANMLDDESNRKKISRNDIINAILEDFFQRELRIL